MFPLVYAGKFFISERRHAADQRLEMDADVTVEGRRARRDAMVGEDPRHDLRQRGERIRHGQHVKGARDFSFSHAPGQIVPDGLAAHVCGALIS